VHAQPCMQGSGDSTCFLCVLGAVYFHMADVRRHNNNAAGTDACVQEQATGDIAAQSAEATQSLIGVCGTMVLLTTSLRPLLHLRL
jgi:hypothetical protein